MLANTGIKCKRVVIKEASSLASFRRYIFLPHLDFNPDSASTNSTFLRSFREKSSEPLWVIKVILEHSFTLRAHFPRRDYHLRPQSDDCSASPLCHLGSSALVVRKSPLSLIRRLAVINLDNIVPIPTAALYFLLC